MPAGSPYVPDTVDFHGAGVTRSYTVAQMNTLYGAGNVKTPTASFVLPWNGVSLNFVKGLPVFCEPALLAKLAALGAPVV